MYYISYINHSPQMLVSKYGFFRGLYSLFGHVIKLLISYFIYKKLLLLLLLFLFFRWDTSVSLNLNQQISKFTYAEVMLSIGDMCRNGIQHHAPLDDPYIYLVKCNIICSYSSNFNLFFLVFTTSDMAQLFLSLDLRKNLILLAMFARLTCSVYYIGC